MTYTVYPDAIDSSDQLPITVDLQTPVRGEVVNRHREAIMAIEAELGVQPSGTYTTVRARLDAIDALIAELNERIDSIESGGGGTIRTKLHGNTIVLTTATMNFTGSGVNVINDGDNTARVVISGGGSVIEQVQEELAVTSDGQVYFTLSQVPQDSTAVQMYVNGVKQDYNLDYNAVGTVVTYIGSISLLTTDRVEFWYIVSGSVSGSGGETFAQTLAIGNQTGGSNIEMSPGDKIVSTSGTVVVDDNLEVTGKLTVAGLIDPTGLVLTEQLTLPAPGTSGHGTVWVDGTTNPNRLVFTHENEITFPITPAEWGQPFDYLRITADGTAVEYFPHSQNVDLAAPSNFDLISPPSTIDGRTPALNDRILLPYQTVAAENGLYVVDVADPLHLTRASDMPAASVQSPGLTVNVRDGVTQSKTTWTLSGASDVTIGESEVYFELQTRIDVTKFAPAGTKRDGTVDWVTYIQAAIDAAIAYGTTNTTRRSSVAVYFPPGVYNCSAPLRVQGALYAGQYLFVSVTLIADAHPFGPSFNAATIIATHKTGPAILFQGARGCAIRYLSIYGQNEWSLVNDQTSFANLVNDATYQRTPGDPCRDNQYSPYAGVCVDPYHSDVTGGNRYPELDGYYVNTGTGGGSSNIIYESVHITGFVVAVMNSPNGTTLNCDGMIAQNCKFDGCKVLWANGQSQTRGHVISGCNLAAAKTLIDGCSYGRGDGSVPSVFGGMCGSCKNLVRAPSYGHSFTWQGVHAESFVSIGEIGGGISPSHATFTACNFQFMTTPANTGTYMRLLAVGHVIIDGCTLNFGGIVSSEPMWIHIYGQVDINGSTIGDYFSTKTGRLFALGNWHNLRFKDSGEWNPGLLSSWVGGSYPHPLGDFRVQTGVIQNITVTEGARFSDALEDGVRFISNKRQGVSLGVLTITCATPGNGTATIAGDLRASVAPGDILEIGNVGDTPFEAPFTAISPYGPIGRVASVTAGTTTLEHVPHWMTTRSTNVYGTWRQRLHSAGTATVAAASPTTLTNVTNYTHWQVNDRIRDTDGYIQENTFILSIAGDDFTLSQSMVGLPVSATLNLYGAEEIVPIYQTQRGTSVIERYISVGADPATSGAVRLSNNDTIEFRNIDGDGNIIAVRVDDSNQVVVGDTTSMTGTVVQDGYSVQVRVDDGIAMTMTVDTSVAWTAADNGYTLQKRDGVATWGINDTVQPVSTVVELRNKIGVTGDVVRLAGYASPLDGAEGDFIWSATPVTDNDGTVFNFGGFGSSSSGWRRLNASGPTNVLWFGAGVGGDVTTAITRAVNAATGTYRTVLFPKGNYGITSTITISQDRVRLVGEGKHITTITFNPGAPGLACFSFTAGASVLYQCGISGMGFVSGNLTDEKICIRATDTSEISIEDIAILNLTGNTSIGIQLRGRELTNVKRVSIQADRPISIEGNPNTTIDCDHYHFEDLYLMPLSSTGAGIYIDGDNVNITSFTMDGTNNVAGGKYGIYFPGTLGAPQPCIGMSINGFRWEQAADPAGFAIWITRVVYNLNINDCLLSNTNGLHLNYIITCEIRNSIFEGAGGATALEVSGCWSIKLENFFRQVGSVTNWDTMVCQYSFPGYASSGSFNELYTLPLAESSVTFGEIKHSWGTGSPESIVTGSVGDMYNRRDGYDGYTVYIKESGEDSTTGWRAIPTTSTTGVTEVLYLSAGDGYTALTGAVRLANDDSIRYRDSSNSSDITAVSVDGLNRVVIGDSVSVTGTVIQDGATVQVRVDDSVAMTMTADTSVSWTAADNGYTLQKRDGYTTWSLNDTVNSADGYTSVTTTDNNISFVVNDGIAMSMTEDTSVAWTAASNGYTLQKVDGVATWGINNTIQSVASVTALRAKTGATGDTVYLAGYTSDGDGAEGYFKWSATAAVDDGGTVLNVGGIGTSAAGWRRVFSGRLDARWFGARGNAQETIASINIGSFDATCAGLTAAHIGRLLCIDGAGAGGADLVGTITNVVGTTVTLDIDAAATVTNVSARVGTDNRAALRLMSKAAQLRLTGPVPYKTIETYIPNGNYLVSCSASGIAAFEINSYTSLFGDDGTTLIAASSTDIILRIGCAFNTIKGIGFRGGKHAIALFGASDQWGGSIGAPQNSNSVNMIDRCTFYYQHGPSIWQDTTYDYPNQWRSIAGHISVVDFNFFGQTLFWGCADGLTLRNGWAVIDETTVPVDWDGGRGMGWIVSTGTCSVIDVSGAPSDAQTGAWFEGCGHISSRGWRMGGESAKVPYELRTDPTNMVYDGYQIPSDGTIRPCIYSINDAIASTAGVPLIKVFDVFPAVISIKRPETFGVGGVYVEYGGTPYVEIDEATCPMSSWYDSAPSDVIIDVDHVSPLIFITSGGTDVTHTLVSNFVGTTRKKAVSTEPQENVWPATVGNLSYDVSYGWASIFNEVSLTNDTTLGVPVRLSTSTSTDNSANIVCTCAVDANTAFSGDAGIYTISTYVKSNFSGYLYLGIYSGGSIGFTHFEQDGYGWQRVEIPFYHDGSSNRRLALSVYNIPGTDGYWGGGSIALACPMINKGPRASEYILPGATLEGKTVTGVTANGVRGLVDYLAVGIDPAATGIIRIPNNSIVTAREAGNTGDIPLFQLDAANNIVIGHAAAAAVYADAAYSINFRVSGNALRAAITTTSFDLSVPAVTWASTVVSPSIRQTTDATNGATGDTLTIQAQSMSGTTSIGGTLELKAGTGTSSNGGVYTYAGSTHYTWLNPAGAWYAYIASSPRLAVTSGEVAIGTGTLDFSESIASPVFMHTGRSTDAAVTDMLIKAQDAKDTATVNVNGGNLKLRSGAKATGSGQVGTVQLYTAADLTWTSSYAGGASYFASPATGIFSAEQYIQFWGKIGANYIDTATTSGACIIYYRGTGFGTGRTDTLTPTGAMSMVWGEGGTSVEFSQAARTTDVAASTLTIRAQDAKQTGTPTNNVGGDIILRTGMMGSGGTDGVTKFYSGSTYLGQSYLAAGTYWGVYVAATNGIVFYANSANQAVTFQAAHSTGAVAFDTDRVTFGYNAAAYTATWGGSGTSVTLSQAQRSGDVVAPSSMYLAPQAPAAGATLTRRKPGDLVVALAAPTNGGTTEAAFKITRGGTTYVQAGAYGPDTGYTGVWLAPAATPDTANYSFAASAANLYLNAAQAGGTVYVTTGGANVASFSSTQVEINGSTDTMIEAVEIAAGRRVVSLVLGADLTTTQMPTNTGDRVVFVANAATNPSANPVGGFILYSNAGTPTFRTSDGYTLTLTGLAVGGANQVFWSNGSTNSWTGAPTVTSLIASSYVAVGTSPALTGDIRIPCAGTISARRAAGDQDTVLLTLSGSDVVQHGGAFALGHTFTSHGVTQVGITLSGIYFATAVATPALYQSTAVQDAAPQNLTIRAQYAHTLSAGPNNISGSVVVDIGPPTNGGTTEGAFYVTRNNVTFARIGPYTTSATYSALYLTPGTSPTTTNYAMLSDAASTWLNAPNAGSIYFLRSNATIALFDTSNRFRIAGTTDLTLFGATFPLSDTFFWSHREGNTINRAAIASSGGTATRAQLMVATNEGISFQLNAASSASDVVAWRSYPVIHATTANGIMFSTEPTAGGTITPIVVLSTAGLVFDSGLASVGISQATHATTARTLTIQAAHVTTGTGSDIMLQTGNGSVADGTLKVLLGNAGGYEINVMPSTGFGGPEVRTMAGNAAFTVHSTGHTYIRSGSSSGQIYLDALGSDGEIHARVNAGADSVLRLGLLSTDVIKLGTSDAGAGQVRLYMDAGSSAIGIYYHATSGNPTALHAANASATNLQAVRLTNTTFTAKFQELAGTELLVGTESAHAMYLATTNIDRFNISASGTITAKLAASQTFTVQNTTPTILFNVTAAGEVQVRVGKLAVGANYSDTMVTTGSSTAVAMFSHSGTTDSTVSVQNSATAGSAVLWTQNTGTDGAGLAIIAYGSTHARADAVQMSLLGRSAESLQLVINSYTFAPPNGAFGTEVVHARFFRGGAIVFGNDSHNDTEAEADAGMTGTILNIATCTGTIDSVSNQATLYNQSGRFYAQGHAGVKLVAGTDLVATFEVGNVTLNASASDLGIGIHTSGSATQANISLFTNTGSYGSGEGVLFIKDCTTVPGSAPTGGGILYSTNGAELWWVNTNGDWIQLA